ncbi:MAG: ergothioneine biosynthesis protein EgtB [Armatimonadetes bacterium]|nr:ergothioneine biosynthesis protein EgtB [Armatimonadota bacterium]
MTLAERMRQTRARTTELAAMAPEESLTRSVHPFYSPLGWHLGHVGMVEEYWILERAFGLKPECPDLSFIFANVPENPKGNRVNLPSREETLDWLAGIRSRVLACLAAGGSGPLCENDYCFRFALQHEHQHQETIVELLQLMRPAGSKVRSAQGRAIAFEMVRLTGGTFRMGTDALHAYDNEKMQHELAVGPFLLGKYPVTVADYMEFMDGGGYSRPELWTPEGWSWRESEGAEAPEYWEQLSGSRAYRSPVGFRMIAPHEPVASLSWFEADAFARWKGMRLPTEAEWEFAASGGQRRYPWGDEEPTQERANFGLSKWGVSSAGGHPAGATPDGIHDMAGQVWEWTSTPFAPYSGFVPYPYDGYSFEHMDGGHRVLRGGSWASQAEILRCTFRNWYVPTYRQGLLGMRLAADA